MTDSVIYTEINFKKSAGQVIGTGMGIVPADRADKQTQCNSKLIWVLSGAIFILLVTVIGMAIEMVRLHGESSRCHLKSQGEQQRRNLWLEGSRTKTPPTVIQHSLCLDGWETYKGLCYFIGSQKLTRFSALETCSNISSQLANPEDSDTLTVLRQHMAYISYWIGLNRLQNENGTSWFWTDGRQLQKSFFSNTDHSERSCATVSKQNIFAENCNIKKGYICEKKADT